MSDARPDRRSPDYIPFNRPFVAGRELYYMSALVTNILRKNSAAEHQALATRIQQLVVADHKKK